MKRWRMAGIACWFAACGGSSSDASGYPDVITTAEVCKVDGDCKIEAREPVCRDSHTAVRYETATCGVDRQCAWSKLEQRCDLRCEDGYCLTSAHR